MASNKRAKELMQSILSVPAQTIVAIVSALGEAAASIVDVVAVTVVPATITLSEVIVATTNTEATIAVVAINVTIITTILIGSSQESTREIFWTMALTM